MNQESENDENLDNSGTRSLDKSSVAVLEKQNNRGRKPGSLNKKTIETKVAEEEFRQRILSELQELIRAQLTIAKGASYLFKIVEEKDSKGRVLSKKHILVEDPNEIIDFLDELEGEDGVVNDSYYYMTTKTPDNRALDSLIDRVFGKSMQRTEATVKSFNIHQIVGMKIIDDRDKSS